MLQCRNVLLVEKILHLIIGVCSRIMIQDLYLNTLEAMQHTMRSGWLRSVGHAMASRFTQQNYCTANLLCIVPLN